MSPITIDPGLLLGTGSAGAGGLALILWVLNKLDFVKFGRKNCKTKCPDPRCQESVHIISANVGTLVANQGVLFAKVDKAMEGYAFIRGKLKGVKIILTKDEAE